MVILKYGAESYSSEIFIDAMWGEEGVSWMDIELFKWACNKMR